MQSYTNMYFHIVGGTESYTTSTTNMYNTCRFHVPSFVDQARAPHFMNVDGDHVGQLFQFFRHGHVVRVGRFRNVAATPKVCVVT
jgi:hypothetical protein